MYIQEIIIDGFKSYAHRTVVDGFDPHFNAITGLNGSGKSNILDSICFVLGITNLSQVRAGNLSELVYKQGQAGVHKASVTIIFNNDDEATSPVGFEQSKEVTVTRQVLIGGKSKYLINGRNALANQVQNMFHSVQLNVNNPHFLIMQGRITKVLNMKPSEILGMVEEAAGTRMYESKRVQALKTIDKKQRKVDELNSVLTEDITPTLEKLRAEKENYLKWSKNSSDIERLERLVIANNFTNAQRALENNNEGVTEMREKVKKLKELVMERRNQVVEKERAIEVLNEKLCGEFDNVQKKAKAREEQASKELVKLTSSWQNSKTVVKAAEKDLQAANELVQETKKSVDIKNLELEKETDCIQSLKQETADAFKLEDQLKTDYQNMSAGISSSQGDEGRTLPEQISKAHSDSKTAEARSLQAKMKIDHLSKSLKTVKRDMDNEKQSAEKLTSEKTTAQAKVEDAKTKLTKLNFSEDLYNKLEDERVDLERALNQMKEKAETLSAQLEARLRFNYSDPVRGFDRSKVKGLVANLASVKKKEHATALEVVAGSKLYQIVVDEAITGKALLKNGKLEKRVTIIPLDKIRPRRVTSSACNRAKDVASQMKTNASPAIELVGFDEEVRNAIEYVFGSSIVVDGMNAANRICDDTKTQTVTLDGDVYDPSGTISGGSRNNLGTTLSKLTELSELREMIREKSGRFNEVMARLQPLKKKTSVFEQLSDELELAGAQLANCEKHLSQTKFGMLADKHDSIEKEIEAALSEQEKMDLEKTQKWELYQELQEKEDLLTQEREDRLSQIDDSLKHAKKDAAEKASRVREVESRLQSLQLELDSLTTEVVAAEQAVAVAQKVLRETNEGEENLARKVRDASAKYDEAKQEYKSVEEEVSRHSSEIKDLKGQKADLVKEIETNDLGAKRLSVQISKIEKERAHAEKYVASMLEKHSWIEHEREFFGVTGGDYDFADFDERGMAAQLERMKTAQETLAKRINRKVMGMIEKAEAEYAELLRKRKVVEKDKKKIQDVIEELDVKKKAELERTWIKVNKDFGSIFSTLLPGTSAKLEPPEGMQAWEGLEVKVAFGDVWKESLSELSGGQRSLLALSLILSMLLFKPAPMYILDEVDAALDLSHTQNIGSMLKTHFSQSQFIVVSLKEGMFNNANVIFRTKFVDGVSTVTRTIGIGKSARGRALDRRFANSDEEDTVSSKEHPFGRRSLGKENLPVNN